jgi:hypothetical protein
MDDGHSRPVRNRLNRNTCNRLRKLLPKSDPFVIHYRRPIQLTRTNPLGTLEVIHKAKENPRGREVHPTRAGLAQR